jgi:ABC-2 type transport system permease protein
MGAIFQKEIKSFFSSIVGYVVIIMFLLLSGLFMWVLPDTNLLDFGYASMDKFFEFAPWLLLFLIPAITMRSFPEEWRTGTIELLLTKPLTELQIIWGKFWASLVLVGIAILPTIIYIISLKSLSADGHVLDVGSIIGSYIGLLLLAAAFTAVGLLCSALTTNQIVSFLISLFSCYLIYAGFEALSGMAAFKGNIDYWLSQIGCEFHYKNINRGVIDTRDIVYFISIILLFVACTLAAIKSRNWSK